MTVSQQSIEQAQSTLDRHRDGNADWVAEIEKWLTPEERGALVAEATKYVYNSQDRTGFKALAAMQEVAHEVGLFVQDCHGNMAHWLADGMNLLIGWDANLKLNANWRRGADDQMTVQDLRDRFQDALEDDHDNSWFPVNDRALAEAWLSQTPYQVWKAVKAVEEHGLDTLRDNYFDLARGNNDGRDIASAMQKRWEDHINQWKKAWAKAA